LYIIADRKCIIYYLLFPGGGFDILPGEGSCKTREFILLQKAKAGGFDIPGERSCQTLEFIILPEEVAAQQQWGGEPVRGMIV